jgi:PmbA protein
VRASTAASSTEPLELFSDLVGRAMRRGATAAEAMLVEGGAMSVSQRLGKREDLLRSEGREAGVRVFFGKQQAMASSSDLSPGALSDLLERVILMAKAVPEEPFCGLADPDLLVHEIPDLDLCDPHEAEAEELYERAAAAEDAARAVPGVTNSNGAGASWSQGGLTLVTSGGFTGSMRWSAFEMSTSVLAGTGTAMETDYATTNARFAADLQPAAQVGTEAGTRAVRRLDARKVDTGQMPVVLEPRISNMILGALAGCINGQMIARGSSLLRDDMGKAVFAPGITIVDDPLRKRGLGSRPFDGEGVRQMRRTVIDNGVLQTWLLSTSDAMQLGLQSTGHAARGINSPPYPSPSNLYMEPGTIGPADLMRDIHRGLYLTNVYGSGIDIITGDVSLGAAGFLIENGEITVPVAGITVAGNLREIFRNVTPANDLAFRYGTDAPTLRVEGMIVAGN